MSIRKKSRLSPDLIIAISIVVSEKVVKDDVKRNQVLKRKRLDWDFHGSQLLRESQFRKYYRMSARSFEKLLSIVGPKIITDRYMSMKRTSIEPVSPANKLQLTLSWLSGGMHHHIRMLAGVSVSFFYRIIYEVIDAINQADELRIQFPATPADRVKVAAGFRRLSSRQVIPNCIGCIDGWLCPIKVPTSDSVANVRSFFSGHYQRYGINVQACCDAYCRFTAFSATSPGGTNDALAFLKWKFSKYLKDLMEAFIVLGDNAYVIDYNLLTPFDKCEMGADWRTKDVYNFYFSQLRIRIEMSFGLLVNKWGVLQKPLKVDISKVSHVIHVCMRLHNFCVDERMLDDSGYSVDNEIDNIIATTMTNPEDFFYCATVDSTMPSEINHSLGHYVRQMLVDRISSLNMTRPASNIIRRFGTTTNR
jgi:hypothetical protein